MVAEKTLVLSINSKTLRILYSWHGFKEKTNLQGKIEKKKEKRKKAQRAALDEEHRLKIERFELSEKKVKEWFKDKRKEARKLWRQNHPKVSPFDMASEDQIENSPPPPEYRVVKTFKQKNTSSLKARSISPVSSSSKVVDNMSDTAEPETRHTNSVNEQQAKQMRTSQSMDTGSAAMSSRGIERPKTAHNLRSTKIKTATRPKTAKASSSETKEGTNSNESPKLMKSLSYDDWLKAKRAQDKRKIIEKRRELIDSHMEAVISKLGKQRVEKIMSTKKQVDTGLKSFSRSNAKSASLTKKSSYEWRNSHNLPRPEPQGCDCSEAEHLDDDTSKSCESKYIPMSPSSHRKKAVEFCEEVNQKYDGLKPCIDKVLAVLDSEMKKCSSDKNPKTNSTTKAPSLISTTNATCNDTINSIPGTVDEPAPPCPKPARPTSARPKLDLVDNTNLTRNEAKQKIFHDMDVLGLCDSNENLSNSVAKLPDKNPGDTVAKRQFEKLGDAVARIPDNLRTSTVRSNYFDYGTEVDVPTISKLQVPTEMK